MIYLRFQSTMNRYIGHVTWHQREHNRTTVILRVLAWGIRKMPDLNEVVLVTGPPRSFRRWQKRARSLIGKIQSEIGSRLALRSVIDPSWTSPRCNSRSPARLLFPSLSFFLFVSPLSRIVRSHLVVFQIEICTLADREDDDERAR